MKNIHISEQWKNITKISTGTVIGQVISIVTLPVITRLYGAEIIGTWTVINSMANIVQNICDLGLSNSLMVCGEDEIDELHTIVMRITFFLSLLLSFIVFLYYMYLGEGLKYSLTICFFLAAYAFTLREINTCYIILNRNKKYDILMKNPMIRFTGSSIIAISLGVIGWKSLGYFIGTMMGQILTLLHMKRFLPKIKKVPTLSCYHATISKYKNFVKYQMPASIMVTLRTELPNILIGALFGNTMLGYFSISQKLLTIPVTFLGQSLGKLFYQTIASMQREGKNISYFVNQNIKRGMLVSFIPMVILAAFGDVAVKIFFGMDYAIGGMICRIIVYRSLFNFISSATQGIDIVLDKQQYVLYTCLLQTILAILSILVGFYAFSSIYITSFFLVITFIIVQLWYFCKMYTIMGMRIIEYLKNAIGVLSSLFIVSWMLRGSFFFIVKSLNINFLNQLLKYFC